MTKYYSETRYYYKRGAGVWLEDTGIRTEKREVSKEAYEFFVFDVFAGCKPLKNHDGSISYSTRNDCDHKTETTFWIKEEA